MVGADGIEEERFRYAGARAMSAGVNGSAAQIFFELTNY
jgi:hypothetical protein